VSGTIVVGERKPVKPSMCVQHGGYAHGGADEDMRSNAAVLQARMSQP
jgi:hypothetical protein